MAGMHVAVGSPAGYEPDGQVVRQATEVAVRSGGRITVTNDPLEAARDADAVYTDVWTSMGQESENDSRTRVLRPFQVGAQVMQAAKPDALVLHCLPAHRGEEITAEVMDGPNSVVFEQAGNRLHSQKALLAFLLA
jgi:ornithine carbamoyltransferase